MPLPRQQELGCGRGGSGVWVAAGATASDTGPLRLRIGAAAAFLGRGLFLDEIHNQAVLVPQELHHLRRGLSNLHGGLVRDVTDRQIGQQQTAEHTAKLAGNASCTILSNNRFSNALKRIARSPLARIFQTAA